jgi:hypothetical protein
MPEKLSLLKFCAKILKVCKVGITNQEISTIYGQEINTISKGVLKTVLWVNNYYIHMLNDCMI